ncbi:Dna polymerase gamma [Mycena venus]|uniref:Dna polymerase gamma n=1 Tax=Mycena venus TaxID=2733690 RepID=A0A8H6XFA3_9AGAR|nr:Dna polymerase gamma [Mycena venus]
MYKSIFLFSGGWTGAFEMFEKHPELCVHVRRLGVDLIYEALRPELWRDDVDIDHIAALIEKASGRLLNLQTFTWSGRRLPPDHLFRTLRNACPQLKNLHCLTKSIRIDPGSELFKFDDLAGFTLWVAYDDKISEPTPMQDIPVELGDMLLQRCPNLNTLSIRLRSMPNIWIQDVEIDRLLSGVWPKLRVCDLEIEVIDSDPILVWPPASTLRGFFSVHSSITELMLQSYARFPTTVLTRELPLIFDASALGQLTSFEGLLQHVAEIPDPAALKILVLCTVVSETSAEPILAVLRRLTSLRGLTLEFSDIKASTFIRDIVSACPSVASLHVKFYKTVFNLKQLADFSAGLRDLSQLRSLYFDKVYSSSDGTLLATALMLLGDIPLLQEICIVNFMANH